MKGKCVLVTGATKGIGWAISRRLADQGAFVVGIARSVSEIDFPGFLYQCDLSDAGQTEDVLRAIREKYPVDMIVNNTGAYNVEPIGQVSLSNLYQLYDLNFRLAVQVTQAFLESMKQRREGRIVNVTSQLALDGAYHTSYAGSKAALAAATKVWALELADYGITVNAVSPGPVETDAFRYGVPVGSDIEKHMLSTIPMKRFSRPEDVAAAVTFFLSDETSMITGQVLGVDGGVSLPR